jgi:DNA polymerase-3 subunit epsilon
LCKRLGVDNSHREVHGALLDAHLLADVWVAMTAGQGALALGGEQASTQAAVEAAGMAGLALTMRPRVLRATAQETVAHDARLDALDKTSGGSLWRRESVEPVAEPA